MAMLPKSQMSVRHTTSQFMAIWTGPLAEFYHAQQKALGFVVEKMRLCFQFCGQLCCLAKCLKLGAGRQCYCLLNGLILQRPSVTSTLTSTPPAMTPTATMKTTRSETKMPCDHECALCASRLCGLKASLLVIFFDFDTPQHS